MADVKISALPAASTPLTGAEVLPIVQSGVTAKVAVSNLTAGLSGTASININGTVGVSTPNTGAFSTLSATGTSTLVAVNASGVIATSDTTAATSAITGALKTAGGLGVLKGIFAGSSSSRGTIDITGTSGAGPSLTFNDNQSGAQSYITGAVATNEYDIFDGTRGAYVFRASNTGIITMSAYGAGAATFSASGVISSVSDETWKTKDGVPTDPDAMLQKLAPGYWYYNDEKKETFGTDRQLGFYAQNVNAAIGPEAAPEPETVITKNKDGTETSVTKPWGYYDRSVLAVAVMSLQNALATIELLTARITALENK